MAGVSRDEVEQQTTHELARRLADSNPDDDRDFYGLSRPELIDLNLGISPSQDE